MCTKYSTQSYPNIYEQGRKKKKRIYENNTKSMLKYSSKANINREKEIEWEKSKRN